MKWTQETRLTEGSALYGSWAPEGVAGEVEGGGGGPGEVGFVADRC